MNKRKGIILAGGSGSRLHPITLGLSKQLLPVYDKPMIYYPLSVLMLAGIREILIITTPNDLTNFKRLLGDGEKWGLQFQYAVQERPEGIAQALIIGEDFINKSPVALILGDNIFYAQHLSQLLKRADANYGATVFVYPVDNPERYGVIEFDETGAPLSIIEKPKNPRSNYGVTGLYFYDPHVITIAKNIKPSARGELEITAINEFYLRSNQLNVTHFSRGSAWLDSGTPDSMLEASQFVCTIEKRQGLKIACLEEIAYRLDYISLDQLKQLALQSSNNDYTKYLFKIIREQETAPHEIYAT